MSRGGSGAGKTATAKRVPPPAVPGDAFGTPQHRHSGSSFGSQGYASCEDQPYPQPPDTPSHTRGKFHDINPVVSYTWWYLSRYDDDSPSPAQDSNSFDVISSWASTPHFSIVIPDVISTSPHQRFLQAMTSLRQDLPLPWQSSKDTYATAYTFWSKKQKN